MARHNPEQRRRRTRGLAAAATAAMGKASGAARSCAAAGLRCRPGALLRSHWRPDNDRKDRHRSVDL